MSSVCAEKFSLADALAPVCASAVGSSGGLTGEQRACKRLWVRRDSLTLKRPVACATRTPNQTKTSAMIRLAAAEWPS